MKPNNPQPSQSKAYRVVTFAFGVLFVAAASLVANLFKVRVVCEELESWFLGDSQAVTAAYPGCRFSNGTTKYRDPDRMTNASQELAKLTGDFSKVGRASMIAPHLDPARNVSGSFQVLFKTLQQHLG